MTRQARLITTRGNDGLSATWEVPPNVPQAQVDAIGVGQQLTVTYVDTIGMRKKSPGEPAVDTVEPTTRMRTATVRVTAVDLAASTVSFTGATGRTYTRRVADPANIERVRALAPGDMVDVSWYENMTIVSGAPVAVAVVPPQPVAAPAVVPDPPDHRWTASVLWGPDNQFSGKMIEAATGRTTGGTPITLDETTYDEAYGRMALFKAGVGYRLSPRSELVVSLVLSRSSSETSRSWSGPVSASEALGAALVDRVRCHGVVIGADGPRAGRCHCPL